MKPPRWVEDATDVSAADADRWLGGDPDAIRLGADATEPLDDEVARLLQREVPHRVGVGGWAPWAGIALAAAAAAAALVVGRPVAPDPLPVTVAPVVVAAVSFTAEGPGDWWIERQDAAGVEIHQQGGTVLYRVDPLPGDARFVVRAGRVEVEVVGTVFEVGTNGADAWVQVYEGKVDVTDGGPTMALAAGNTWERHPWPSVADPVPTRVPAPVEAPPDDGWRREYAALLERFEARERTPALLQDLWSYAATYADDPLGTDARVLALRVAADVQEPASVVAAIEGFLGSTDTHQRPILLQLAADLTRDRLHDCQRAGPLYASLARESRGLARARAEAWQGLCAASLGDPAAPSILERALGDGVDGELRSRVEAAVSALSPERSPRP